MGKVAHHHHQLAQDTYTTKPHLLHHGFNLPNAFWAVKYVTWQASSGSHMSASQTPPEILRENVTTLCDDTTFVSPPPKYPPGNKIITLHSGQSKWISHGTSKCAATGWGVGGGGGGGALEIGAWNTHHPWAAAPLPCLNSFEALWA